MSLTSEVRSRRSSRTAVVVKGAGVKVGACNSFLYGGPNNTKLRVNVKGVIFTRKTSLSKSKLPVAPFIDYIVNRSPYKDVFISKDAKAILRGYAKVDTSKDLYLVHSALVVARTGEEGGIPPAMFSLLVKRGVSEHLAFWASQLIDGTPSDVCPRRGFYNHEHAFDFLHASFYNYCKGIVKEKGVPFNDGGQGIHYSGVGGIFGEGAKELGTRAAIAIALREAVESRNVKKSTYKNPFAKVEKKAVSARLLAKHLAPLLIAMPENKL